MRESLTSIGTGGSKTLISPLNRHGRSTPCRSICSTTYGDFVCRGCKRFAHEIIEWNHLDDPYKEAIWSRLDTVYRESIRACVRVSDAEIFNQYVEENEIPFSTDPESAIYELLQMVDSPVVDLGLLPTESSIGTSSLRLFNEIENEIYRRSLAYYEYYFKRTIDQV